MGKMIRKQVYLAPEQIKLLKLLARKANVTEAEVVRRAIEDYARKEKVIDDDPLLELIGMVKGGPPDASINHDYYLYGPNTRS